MIALDTNVLIRFLVEDDLAQSRRARVLIEAGVRRGEFFYLCEVVLCEAVWVLDRAYGFTRGRIADVLLKLSKARYVVFDSADAVHRAIDSYRRKGGDFADYLILERALAAGCSAVATFDRHLLKDENFIRP